MTQFWISTKCHQRVKLCSCSPTGVVGKWNDFKSYTNAIIITSDRLENIVHNELDMTKCMLGL